MLLFVEDPEHPLLDYVKDDPVRPELSREFRTEKNKFVSVLVDENPRALVCVSLQDRIPKSVSELQEESSDIKVAVFYTIWSYQPGAGSELLRETVSAIKKTYPNIKTFVTLSPKTEMARKFHIKNGAKVYRENESTVNYEYEIL